MELSDELNSSVFTARMFMLAHTNLVSDPCKLTLMTMYFHLHLLGRFPSLSELASKRDLAKSPVKAHLVEATNKGALHKERVSPTKSVYTFRWNKISQSFKFKTEGEVLENLDALMGSPLAVVMNEKEIKVAKSWLKEPTTSAQVLELFRALYSERSKFVYVCQPNDAKLVRLMTRRVGIENCSAAVRKYIRSVPKAEARKLTVQGLFRYTEENAERQIAEKQSSKENARICSRIRLRARTPGKLKY